MWTLWAMPKGSQETSPGPCAKKEGHSVRGSAKGEQPQHLVRYSELSYLGNSSAAVCSLKTHWLCLDAVLCHAVLCAMMCCAVPCCLCCAGSIVPCKLCWTPFDCCACCAALYWSHVEACWHCLLLVIACLAKAIRPMLSPSTDWIDSIEGGAVVCS